MEPNNSNPVDELLDAALKHYGTIEPRPGLEGRILANLRAAESKPQQNRLWWPMAATCAAMLLLAVTVVTLRVVHIRTQQPTAHAIAPASQDHQTEIASNPHGVNAAESHAANTVRTKRPHGSQALATAATARHEQFPSPEPLSPQEQILARYVEQFPREAVLLARAQTELFQREANEREAPPADQMTPDKDTEQQNP